MCCNIPMVLINGETMLEEVETSQMYMCLDCGGYISYTEGQLDIEEVLNNINSFGTYTDKKKFVELHPEFSEEVV